MPDTKTHGRSDEVKIGNYDVLLEELATGTLRLLSCPHVGNNRLEVLLLMNRSEYEESLTAGIDTNPILDKLINIVTQQCVPPGRFLVANRDYDPDSNYEDYEWEEIEIGRARQFLNIALLDADKAGLAGFPSNNSGVDSAAMPPPPPAVSNLTGKNDDSKKRFRRSSLLRRSVSESFVRNVMGDERKSVVGKQKTANRRHSSFFSIRKQKASTKTDQTEDLDILFNFEQTALLPNHVGNNRLRVLLNIHKGKYEKSDEAEQTSSLQEWVRTVTQFWGGRFLRQEEEDAKTYEVLDGTQAELALHSVISEMAPNSDEVASLTSSQGKKMLAVDKVAPPNLNVQDMRSAAVQSLQKRKKRQGLASRLRRLATNTLTRSNSNPMAPMAPSPASSSDMKMPPTDFARASSVPTFERNGGASGVMSLPTSPTPLDNAESHRQSRQRRSSSIILPRFLTGRASLRRNQNLAADGVGRDLRQSLEAGDNEFGPETFGEFPADDNKF